MSNWSFLVMEGLSKLDWLIEQIKTFNWVWFLIKKKINYLS